MAASIEQEEVMVGKDTTDVTTIEDVIFLYFFMSLKYIFKKKLILKV